jgi:hypothetical protein
VREKLLAYSLDLAHESGGPKARGFERILGITTLHIGYLEGEIRSAIATAPIRSVRDNPPHGINCVVEFPLRGVEDKRFRIIQLRTTWGSPMPPPHPG